MIEKYLRTTTQQKLSVLLYGPAATGKTTGARTFPNPHFVDLDNHLPKDVPNVIPIWDDAFINTIVRPIQYTNLQGQKAEMPNRIDAVTIILADLAREMPAGSTVIVDSLTRLENYYNLQEDIMPKPRGRDGEPDTRAMFGKRLVAYGTWFALFASVRANIIFIAHQQQERNEKGELVGQLKPTMMGQMGDKAPSFFNTVLQAVRRGDGKTMEYLWRVRPGNWEPARIPGGAKVDFIPQKYSALAEQIGMANAPSSVVGQTK